MIKVDYRWLICGLLLLATGSLSAQKSPVTAGGVASGSGGTASYSVGEVVYSSYSKAGGLIIEGVQQAYKPSELPITLLEFKAALADKNEVLLSWTTIAEQNNAFFTVERSQDAILFTPIARQNGKGNSNVAQEYAAIDVKPLLGNSYYRLKQTDADGRSSYSAVVAVRIAADATTELTAYPNPTTSILNLAIKGDSFKNLSYSIYTLEGKLVAQQSIKSNITTITTSMLVNGSYLLQVTEKGSIIKTFKVIKK